MTTQSTSFIPQRPTQGKVKNRSVRKVYILAYVSYVLFFATLLSAGGILFYKYALNKTLNNEKAALASQQDRFSESDIASVQDLNQRINLATVKLNDHISVSALFGALESSAVQSVKFIGFDYKRSADGSPSITLKGGLNDFNSLIFQREVFKTNPILANASFSDITSAAVALDTGSKSSSATGATQQVITFTMHKDVPASLIPYVPQILSNPTSDSSLEGDTQGDAIATTSATSSQSVSGQTITDPVQ